MIVLAWVILVVNLAPSLTSTVNRAIAYCRGKESWVPAVYFWVFVLFSAVWIWAFLQIFQLKG